MKLSEFLFKTYNMQESELYMKPALLDIFGMPKDRDCIIYKKKHSVSSHCQKFVLVCPFKQFRIFNHFYR